MPLCERLLTDAFSDLLDYGVAMRLSPTSNFRHNSND